MHTHILTHTHHHSLSRLTPCPQGEVVRGTQSLSTNRRTHQACWDTQDVCQLRITGCLTPLRPSTSHPVFWGLPDSIDSCFLRSLGFTNPTTTFLLRPEPQAVDESWCAPGTRNEALNLQELEVKEGRWKGIPEVTALADLGKDDKQQGNLDNPKRYKCFQDP